MRKGAGDPDCPAREGEDFMSYLHRLAQFQGYVSADAQPPAAFRRKQDRRGFNERLEAIFGKRREPGEDEVEEPSKVESGAL